MRRFSAPAAAAFAIALVGCATTGDAYQAAPPAPEGQAVVYVFRGRIPIGGGWPTNFTIDGKAVVSLYDKGYTWAHLKQGPHRFAAGNMFQDGLKLTLDIEAGKTYYLEYTQEHVGTEYRHVLRTLPADLGQATVSTYQYKRAD